MKDHPIIFSGEMVRAILDERKTQTRRVLKLHPEHNALAPFQDGLPTEEYYGGWPYGGCARQLRCPYGVPGDRLWVRETHLIVGGKDSPNPRVVYRATDNGEWVSPVWSPSIFLPKRFARLWLEVTAVRVERVQEISEADAIAEGVYVHATPGGKDYYTALPGRSRDGKWSASEAFGELWDNINAKRGYGWDANPWVWVLEFKRVEA